MVFQTAKLRYQFSFWIGIVFLCIMGMGGLQEIQAAPQIRITTSIFPLKEFAQAVCGSRGEVHLLLPPGAEIHTWQPRPSEILSLSSSDVFIYVGAHLEPWAHNILKSIQNENLRVMEASKGFALLEKNKDSQKQKSHGTDPHIWLDFEKDQILVDKMARLFSKVDPEGAAVFQKNAQEYKEKLQELHERYQKELQHCEHRTFVLGGHGAFGYLAEKYNLRQISLYGVNPKAEPTPKQLIRVMNLAEKHSIKVIFFEINVSDELAKVMAKELGGRTLVLNPGASLTRSQYKSGVTFIDVMEENLENLKNGLNCR